MPLIVSCVSKIEIDYKHCLVHSITELSGSTALRKVKKLASSTFRFWKTKVTKLWALLKIKFTWMAIEVTIMSDG